MPKKILSTSSRSLIDIAPEYPGATNETHPYSKENSLDIAETRKWSSENDLNKTIEWCPATR